MDAISPEDWVLLPDHKSSSSVEECGNGHGAVGGQDHLVLGPKLVMIDMDHFGPASHPAPHGRTIDGDAGKPLLQPLQGACARDPVTELKDIGVVPAEPKREEEERSKVAEMVMVSGAEEEEEMIKRPAGVKEVEQDEVLVEAAPGDRCAEEDEAGIKKNGFSVGNLRVHAAVALCSFGVAAATFCIFLLGGNQQQQQKRQQNHKIQLQMCADDQGIQQVVQQASRLNQTMSSVMGGASSARASISFGGHYHGF